VATKFRGLGLSDVTRANYRKESAHLALDFVDDQEAEKILNHCEAHLEKGR